MNRSLFLLVLLLAVSRSEALWGKRAPEAKKYVKPTEDSGSSSDPEFFWYNEVTGESHWEIPTYTHIDEASGNTFYYDWENKKTSWEKPACISWSETIDEAEGKTFYVNDVTGETQWEKPAQFAWKQVRANKDGTTTAEGDDDL